MIINTMSLKRERWDRVRMLLERVARKNSQVLPDGWKGQACRQG